MFLLGLASVLPAKFRKHNRRKLAYCVEFQVAILISVPNPALTLLLSSSLPIIELFHCPSNGVISKALWEECSSVNSVP